MRRPEKPLVVLEALRRRPQTADEFATHRGWYINSWAPTFTRLKKAGLARTTGEQRVTSHGAMANVVEITKAGHDFLKAARS